MSPREATPVLAALLRAMARAASAGSCAMATLTACAIDGVGGPRMLVGLDLAAAAPRGELARLDDDLLDDDAFRLELRELLRREIEPFVEGVGQVRVMWGEGLDGVVVLPAEPRGGDADGGHVVPPSSIEFDAQFGAAP